MLVAVSGCLLGQRVRFDAGHKRDAFVMDELSEYADYISFCPEDMAFGSPRPSIRLVESNEGERVISNKTGEDLTDTLQESVTEEFEAIFAHKIGGIIFKAKSPSCGLGSAKTYLDNGYASGKSDGVFAKMCKEAYPLLPMEEEGRLCDAWLRENFIMQLFAYDAFEQFKEEASIGKLVDFHRVHKFMLQSKDERIYRELGQLVGNHEQKPFHELLNEYELLYKTAIAKKSSIGKTRNVLEHMAGFLKKFLSKEEKALLHEQIDDCAAKIVPVIVPLSTLKLYAVKYKVEYLLEQKFLEPYPKELALRSSLESLK
ncbi:MAG: DUF523 and DUF1722 domain-containing protein [Campylobacterales bacterium]|nr:DUF523 and DUF1722 domain-containing protein [Campylobacterales bacterium]